MEMINTPDTSKNINIKLHSSVLAEFSSEKLSYKMFGVLKQYIRRKIIREKYKLYMVKNLMIGIPWI